MYRNKDFIYDAAVEFENITEIPVIVESNRKEYDAIFTINDTQFIVEAKSEIRESNKGMVLAQIKEYQEISNKPVLIIAKFIASDIAKFFKKKSINYIDIAGNAFIKQKNFHVYITGQKVHKVNKLKQSRAFYEVGLRLIFSILNNPEYLQLSYREIAEKTDIAIGSISNIMKELEGLNFILKTESSRILKNKKNLLDKWTVAYNDVLRPRLIKRKMRFSNEFKYTKWEEINLNSSNESKTLWGGEPAGAILTNYLKPSHFTIYTSGTWLECAKELELIPDEKGDIEIIQMFWNFINPKEKDLWIVPPMLIYADLINSGIERNIETAKIYLVRILILY